MKRAQGDRVPAAPAAPNAVKRPGPFALFKRPGDPAPFQCTGQAPQVQPGQPASLRSGVTTYFVLSPVIWLPCHRRLHKGLPLRPGSTPYAGARTTRLGRLLQAPVVRACLDRPGLDLPLSLPPDCETASARRRSSVHRIPSRVRDAAYAPLLGRNGRTDRRRKLICEPPFHLLQRNFREKNLLHLVQRCLTRVPGSVTPPHHHGRRATVSPR